MNGFINYYKPSGISSAYAINRIKKLFKGDKIGHMGTLDPLAEGVLPIAIGKSTRLFDYLLDKEKIYIAEFTFGYETDTLDRGGKVIKEGGLVPTVDEVLKVIPTLVGKVDQLPPLYSAKNVGGERSYDLARRGIEVELKPKTVEIDAIEYLGKNGEAFKFKIVCKGGTYIRSIARDMAYALKTFGTMTALQRIKSGAFTLENSVNEEQILKTGSLESLLIKPESVISFCELILTKPQEVELEHGRECVTGQKDGVYAVFTPEKTFIGMGVIQDGNLKIKARIKD